LWAIRTEEYWYDIGADLKPDGVPLQSSAAVICGERRENLGKDNPIARCLPAGVPTIDTATAALHVTERFRRRDIGHMYLEITMADSRAYTRPWTIKLHPNLVLDTELMEWVCVEDNKGVEHLVGK
jgi:hypothetical protein